MGTARLQPSVHRKILFHSILTFFLTQSILVSASTLPHSENQESCTKTGINLSEGDNNPFGLAITYRCLQVKGDMFSFRTGEYSMKNEAIRCDEEPVYRYRTNIRTNQSIQGAVTECETDVNTVCVSVFAKENNVSISALYLKSEVGNNGKVTFFSTEVFFDIKDQLRRIARKAITAFLQEVTDELDVRRRIFLGAKKTNCKAPETHMCPTDAQCFYQ